MSEQSEAKERQGYVSKAIPVTCATCSKFTSNTTTHSGSYGVYLKETKLRCSIGGFAVKKNGTCEEHELKGAE